MFRIHSFFQERKVKSMVNIAEPEIKRQHGCMEHTLWQYTKITNSDGNGRQSAVQSISNQCCLNATYWQSLKVCFTFQNILFNNSWSRLFQIRWGVICLPIVFIFHLFCRAGSAYSLFSRRLRSTNNWQLVRCPLKQRKHQHWSHASEFQRHLPAISVVRDGANSLLLCLSVPQDRI